MPMMQDPFVRFTEWLEAAKQSPLISEPTAMTLATATPDGRPSTRIVLLKQMDERGFVFYTNLKSRKSADIITNPQVALSFYWMPLERQIRIEGHAEPVTADEADAYFASRPRESQIGAWSSLQSQPLAERALFENALAENTARFEGKLVPRPPFWSGWRVVPQQFEFWQEAKFRLHERHVYSRSATGWHTGLLYP